MLSAQDVSKSTGMHTTAITELAKVGALKGRKFGPQWTFEALEVKRFCKLNGIAMVPFTPKEW